MIVACGLVGVIIALTAEHGAGHGCRFSVDRAIMLLIQWNVRIICWKHRLEGLGLSWGLFDNGWLGYRAVASASGVAGLQWTGVG